MKISGGCHCGFIKFTANADPKTALICHCSDCQTLSSTAYRSIIQVKEDQFTLTNGDLKSYVKTAASGNQRPQDFCPQCGTQIYATSMSPYPRVLNLRLGCVDQRDEIIPQRQIWMNSAQPWALDISAIEGIPEQ